MQSILKRSDYVEFLFQLKFGTGDPLSACSREASSFTAWKNDPIVRQRLSPRRTTQRLWSVILEAGTLIQSPSSGIG
jgi:hypothetical protein